MADSPSRVGFLCDGQLSSEQEAALRWLRGTEATVETVSFADTPRTADEFDALWWHRDTPLGPTSPLSTAAPAVDSFLESGGRLFLTLRAMGDVDALGVETVPPDAAGADSVTAPTGVLWRSLYDDHPAIERFDTLRVHVCEHGTVPFARYESVIPANGEVLASTVREDHDVPHEMTVVGWNAGAGSVLGVGAGLAFDEPASEAVAEARDRFAAGCLGALVDGYEQPERPKDTAELRAMRARVDERSSRPQYHFTPPANWLNDPNGLLKWDGRYHVYYQYNPAGPFHNSIHWGHAVTDDLVTWRDELVALSPSPDGPDRDGCWSGCAVDDGGTPTILYTGGNGRRQLPCLATAADGTLRTWAKHADNPVIEAPPDDIDVLETEHWRAEFRDHCVWREDGRWHQLVGSGITDVGGTALLYTSADLREWHYEGPLLVGDGASEGTVWECPELLDFGEKKLLHVSNYEDVLYFLGEVDDGRFAVTNRGTLDHGEFYAPQSLRDGDRYVTFGWLPEARDPEAQWDAGWSGALSLPRVITVGPEGRLRQRPAEEVTALRARAFEVDESMTVPGGQRRSLRASGTAVELQLAVSLDDATAFELAVFESPDGSERTSIRYTHEGALLVDRATASEDRRVTTDTQRMTVAPDDEPLALRCFLDENVVELYANARHCLTSRVYPTRPDSTGISVAAHGGTAVVDSLSAWRLTGRR